MPTLDAKPKSQPADDVHQCILDQVMQRQQQVSLAGEVAALRREIQALRQELTPVPGLIVTGRAAIDEFKRLTQGACRG